MALQLAWLHAVICQQICSYDTLGQWFSICLSHRKAKLKIGMSYFRVLHFLGVGADDALSSQLLFVYVMNLSINFTKSVPLLVTDILKRVCTDSWIKSRLSSPSPHRQKKKQRKSNADFFSTFIPSKMKF